MLAALALIVPLGLAGAVGPAADVGLASAPAWVPIALTRVAPGPGRRALAAFSSLIDRRGRAAIIVLLAAAGIFFVARGVIRLLG